MFARLRRWFHCLRHLHRPVTERFRFGRETYAEDYRCECGQRFGGKLVCPEFGGFRY